MIFIKNSKFKTQKVYDLERKNKITFAMEDYVEMLYRESKNSDKIRVSTLSSLLNVNVSSASKMISKLKSVNLVKCEKYELIELTEEGKTLGKYLLERHNTLHKFFSFINKGEAKLEQIEQVEHYFDEKTISNIENFLKEYKIND